MEMERENFQSAVFSHIMSTIIGLDLDQIEANSYQLNPGLPQR